MKIALKYLNFAADAPYLWLRIALVIRPYNKPIIPLEESAKIEGILGEINLVETETNFTTL